MSASPAPSASSTTIRSKKVLVPKVWKRPHSTIYGKNVEFGSSLYSDKIGEINGRKFNSELPWSMRNSGGGTAGASSPGIYNQGYLSTLETTNSHNLSLVEPSTTSHGKALTYEHLLEMTNPSRFSKRAQNKQLNNKARETSSSGASKRIDFYDQYGDFNKEIDQMNNSSLLMNEPLLTRKAFDNKLDFDYELGLFVPTGSGGDHRGDKSGLGGSSSSRVDRCSLINNTDKNKDINIKSFNPYIATTQQNFQLLPQHQCKLMSSPYGQSADGRKLSLGSINPQSYRPSLPQKTTTAHSSDGEEFEFHDRSSPFYTDRWAGKTIRHFDSDLYSNANLFKSMIL